MTCKISAIWCLTAVSVVAQAPETLKVPAGQRLTLQVRGIGDQVYTCRADGQEYKWTLKAPDARLLTSDGQVAGRHFAGPTWEAKDGSRVSAKAAATSPSPDPTAVPWLLLFATGHEGAGILSDVLSIQRLNTKGGKAPANGCSSSNAGAEKRVQYEADYFFYGNAK